jgi:hypothetical protein
LPEADEIDRAPCRDRDQALRFEVRSDLLGNFGLRRRGGWRSRNDSQENQAHSRKKRSGVTPSQSPAMRNAAFDLWAFIPGRYAISIHADESPVQTIFVALLPIVKKKVYSLHVQS